MSRGKYEIDMTHGSIMDKLISFALPLCASSLLQLMFNAVDIVVVGRFTGKTALAAVGATSALISIITTMFIGVSLGANVMTALFYARGDKNMLSDTVHTAVTFGLISGIAVGLAGFFLAEPSLELLGTPDNVIEQSKLYMRIYFCGTPFFMLYNYSAAILRAVGDTKRPLVFLIISGVTNAGLNVLLVTAFDMGVAGVAIATVISQCISCGLVLTCLFRDDAVYRLSLKKLKIKGRILWQILKIGLPAGLQSTVISISNSLLQSSVNTFGATAMAGYTAANNIFGFMFAAIDSISQACVSFVSQNRGAHNTKRIDKVVLDCFILQVAFPLLLGVVVYIFSPQLISIYSGKEDLKVIEYGVQVLSYTTISYFICGLMNLFAGALRGLGSSTAPMFITVIGTVGMRVLWIYAFFPMNRTLSFLFISYPLSWVVTALMQIICFLIVRKKVYREIEASA